MDGSTPTMDGWMDHGSSSSSSYSYRVTDTAAAAATRGQYGCIFGCSCSSHAACVPRLLVLVSICQCLLLPSISHARARYRRIVSPPLDRPTVSQQQRQDACMAPSITFLPSLCLHLDRSWLRINNLTYINAVCIIQHPTRSYYFLYDCISRKLQVECYKASKD